MSLTIRDSTLKIVGQGSDIGKITRVVECILRRDRYNIVFLSKPEMSIYFAIAVGGSLGAVSRYWASSTTYSWLGNSFPFGTLLVNVLGSMLMGFLSVLLVQRFNVSDEVRLGLLVGFLGSFTTFSTFALDSLHWYDNGAISKAMAYILLSVVFSILGAWAGIITAKQYFLR
jgi:CrcB protein